MSSDVKSAEPTDAEPSSVLLYTKLSEASFANFENLHPPNHPANDYGVWESRLRFALRDMKLWTIVTGERPRPSASHPRAQDAWDQDDDTAMGWIHTKIDIAEAKRLKPCRTSAECLDVLSWISLWT
ncbi:hypothetical protein [Phaffia rhodozyma]|uniref:DUF4219 domain-containing protein n=1 Tax=Phaffia rhodozyma TaxID=264483 RepID=A0A0F7SPQ8_PHARH|nr:hypothetical protein [Phaffia rhodozyma]